MSKQFTPCPACGAVGEVNSTCLFCGTTILLKEGATTSDARVVEHRTVTPQQYAEKISIYHNIESLGEKISKVAIGQQEGIINLNGDLIYPLGNDHITKERNEGFVKIGNKILNLENFELTDDPYLNKTVLEKISTLSRAIMNNPETEAGIAFGIDEDSCSALAIINSCDYETLGTYDCAFSPQLLISLYNLDTDDSKYLTIYNRFTSCDEFKLFDEFLDEYGNREPIQTRHHYLLCGNDAEKCCSIVLRIYEQICNVSPKDVLENNHYDCNGDIFEQKNDFESNFNKNHSESNEIYSNSNENYSNSNGNSNENEGGCLGMLALLLSIGGAGIYGLTQLISNLIA